MNRHPDNQTPQPSPVGWFVATSFVGLAAWFAMLSPRAEIPLAPAAVISIRDIAPGARREPLRDPPTVVSGGFALGCNECHRIFQSPAAQHRPLLQHTHIVLQHGMNDNCFNCHDRQDRQRLVLRPGVSAGFNDVVRVCARCHGTLFRDWQRGTHGKTMGSWDGASGRQVRLGCTECHDPHAPAYRAIAPLPPPTTLRMGNQAFHAEPTHGGPLQRGAARSAGGGHGEDHP